MQLLNFKKYGGTVVENLLLRESATKIVQIATLTKLHDEQNFVFSHKTTFKCRCDIEILAA